MRWRIVAALALLAVGLGAVGLVVFRPGSGTTTTQLLTGVASTTDVVEDVAASGTLSASATYGLAFGSDPQLVSGTASSTASGSGGSSSWLVETVTVAVGDQVTAGQALATADTSSAAAALALAQANLTTAQAKLATDIAGLSGADKASAYDQVRQAQQSLSQAKSSQANTKAQNDLKLAQAQAALATAQAKLAADQAAGPASSLIEADQAAVTQAQQQLDSLNLADPGVGCPGGSHVAAERPQAEPARRPPWRPPRPSSRPTSRSRPHSRSSTPIRRRSPRTRGRSTA